MFKYLFIFILFASCTKEPIPYKIGGGKKDCLILSKFGEYKSFKYLISNWNYTDTLVLSTYRDSIKIVFPGQTKVNKVEYAFTDAQFCNKMDYNTINKFIDSNLQHRIHIKNDTLVDYVIVKKDTLGIKYYKKFQ